MNGIVNDPGAIPVSDEFASIVKAADEHGLNVIIVGAGCDTGSTLMRMLIESAKFEIFQQPSLELINRKERKHQQGGGPRNRWGELR